MYCHAELLFHGFCRHKAISRVADGGFGLRYPRSSSVSSSFSDVLIIHLGNVPCGSSTGPGTVLGLGVTVRVRKTCVLFSG